MTTHKTEGRMAPDDTRDAYEPHVAALNGTTNAADDDAGDDEEPSARLSARRHQSRPRYIDVYMRSAKADSCTWSLPGDGRDGRAGDIPLRLHGSWLEQGLGSLTHAQLHEVLHPDDRDAVAAVWDRAVAAQSPFSTECRVLLPGGRERRLAVHALPQFDARSRLRRWVGFCQDITARWEHERERELALTHAQAARVSHELATRLARERAAVAGMTQAQDQLEALQALTDIALAHLRLEDLLPEVLDRLQAILAVDNVAILLLAADGQTLEGRLALGVEAAEMAQVRVPVGAGFAGRIAATRQPLVVEDLARFPVVNPLLLEQLRSALGVPLLCEQRLLGVLHVGTRQRRAFSAADVQLLQQAAERIALAIERAQLFEAEQESRAEAEQLADKLDRIVEGITDGVIAYDAQGRVMLTNTAARRILGLDAAPPDYYQRSFPERASLYAVRDAQSHPVAREEGLLARALREEELTASDAQDVRMRTLDGRDVELTISAAPLRDREGRLVGAVSIYRDQTEHNRLEREREEAQASEWAAREVAHQMDLFFAIAAHDIRSPVTAVLVGMHLAQRRAEQLAAAVQALGGKEADLAAHVLASLATAENSVDRLVRMAERLFDVAQARSGKLEVQLAPCDLAEVMREQVAAQRVAARCRTIRLKLPDQAVTVLGDADRLGQVLANYVTNALKYSADDQPIEVSLKMYEGQAIVAVRDAGPGLPPEEQVRVWEMFHRASGVDARSSVGGAGSLGLGLYICKRFVELHHGQVGVESVVGEGSTFWFRLPLASGGPAVDAAQAPALSAP